MSSTGCYYLINTYHPAVYICLIFWTLEYVAERNDLKEKGYLKQQKWSRARQ